MKQQVNPTCLSQNMMLVTDYNSSTEWRPSYHLNFFYYA